MCGRFTLHHPTDQVAERFGVQEVLFEEPARYNIAPTQPIAAITAPSGTRFLEGFRWGLVPFWAKDVGIGNRLINARAETLAEKPSFKHALMRRRCLIPADGFYEWKKEASSRQPMYLRKQDGALFAFAGLWEEWKQDDGERLRTCTIITVAPNALVATIHDRMPVLLRPEDEALWLDVGVKDTQTVLGVLQPYPSEAMEAFAVSKQVNAPGVDDATNLEPMQNSA